MSAVLFWVLNSARLIADRLPEPMLCVIFALIIDVRFDRSKLGCAWVELAVTALSGEIESGFARPARGIRFQEEALPWPALRRGERQSADGRSGRLPWRTELVASRCGRFQ